jgi:hypothetical protein
MPRFVLAPNGRSAVAPDWMSDDQVYQYLGYSAPAPSSDDQGGFIAGVKSGFGADVSGLGHVAEDISGQGGVATGLRQYGEQLQKDNPLFIDKTTLGQQFASPWRSVKEYAGEAVGMMAPAALAVAAAPEAVPIAAGTVATAGTIGGPALAAYGQMEQQQVALTGHRDPGMAALGAAGVGALGLLGPGGQAVRGLLGRAETVVGENAARDILASSGQSALKRGALGFAKGAAEGAAAMTGQTALTRWGAGQDVFGDNTGEDYTKAAVVGALLGGTVRAPLDMLGPSPEQVANAGNIVSTADALNAQKTLPAPEETPWKQVTPNETVNDIIGSRMRGEMSPEDLANIPADYDSWRAAQQQAGYDPFNPEHVRDTVIGMISPDAASRALLKKDGSLRDNSNVTDLNKAIGDVSDNLLANNFADARSIATTLADSNAKWRQDAGNALLMHIEDMQRDWTNQQAQTGQALAAPGARVGEPAPGPEGAIQQAMEQNAAANARESLQAQAADVAARQQPLIAELQARQEQDILDEANRRGQLPLIPPSDIAALEAEAVARAQGRESPGEAIRTGEPTPPELPSETTEPEMSPAARMRGTTSITPLERPQMDEFSHPPEGSIHEATAPRDAGPVVSEARMQGTQSILAGLKQIAEDTGHPFEKSAPLAHWLISQNPHIASDLTMDVRNRTPEEVAAGRGGGYSPIERVATLLSSPKVDPSIATHEIAHHMERMMPQKVQDAVRQRWASDFQSKLAAVRQSGDAVGARIMEHLANYHAHGDVADLRAARQAMVDTGRAKEFHQFTNPSEYWAENAARLIKDRFDASPSVYRRAVQWLKEFRARVMDAFGLKSDHPFIQALDSVLKGDGSFRSDEMLSARGSGDGLYERGSAEAPTLHEAVAATPEEEKLATSDDLKAHLANIQATGELPRYPRTAQQFYDIAGSSLRGALLRVNTLDYIVRAFEKVMPSLGDVRDARETKFVERSKMLEPVQDILARWSKLSKDHDNDLKFLMNGADATGIDFRKSKTDAMEDVRAKLKDQPELGAYYDQMRDVWNRLGATDKGREVQKLFNDQRKINDDFFQRWVDVRKEHIDANEALSDAQKAAMKAKLSAQRIPMYQMRGRFGRYGVTVVDEHGRQVTERFEHEWQRNEQHRRWQADGYKPTSFNDMDYIHSLDATAQAAITKMKGMFSDPELAQKFGKDVQQMLTELEYRMSPEQSGKRNFIKRNDIAGWSTDTQRSFASGSQRMAQMLANIEYGKQIQPALYELEKDGRGNPVHAEVANAVRHHIAGDLTEGTGAISRFLMNASYLHFLGATPAFWVMHFSQTPMVTLPLMAARYGYGRTSAELMRALKDASVVGTADLTEDHLRQIAGMPKLNRDLSEAAQARVDAASSGDKRLFATLLQMHRLGDFAHTLTSEIAAQAQGRTDWMSKTTKALSLGTKTLDQINRLSAAIAAHRMQEARNAHDFSRIDAEVAGGTRSAEEAAAIKSALAAKSFEMAREYTLRSHGDYSEGNAPLLFKKNAVTRLMSQFRSWPLQMAQVFLKSMKDGYFDKTGLSPEERAIARRQFQGLMATSAVFAGSMGTPLSGIALGMANGMNALFGDKNKAWNADVAWENFLHDMFGKTGGEIAAHGILDAVLPADISNRLHLSNILSPIQHIQTVGKTNKDIFKDYVYALGGPVVGMGGDLAKATDMLHRGDIYGAVMQTMPKGPRDLMNALREGGQGLVSSTGKELMAPDQLTPADRIVTALGFQPTKVAQAYAKKDAIAEITNKLADRKSIITQQYVRAALSGDTSGMQQARKDAMDFNKALREQRQELPPGMRASTAALPLTMGHLVQQAHQAKLGPKKALMGMRLSARTAPGLEAMTRGAGDMPGSE